MEFWFQNRWKILLSTAALIIIYMSNHLLAFFLLENTKFFIFSDIWGCTFVKINKIKLIIRILHLLVDTELWRLQRCLDHALKVMSYLIPWLAALFLPPNMWQLYLIQLKLNYDTNVVLIIIRIYFMYDFIPAVCILSVKAFSRY